MRQPHALGLQQRTLGSPSPLQQSLLHAPPPWLHSPPSTPCQVEPGCVTPLALANPSAAHCLLLLDAKLAALGDTGVWVHPIVNSASLALSPAQLEAFLK